MMIVMASAPAPAITKDEQLVEIAKCYRKPAYFIGNYCKIYDAKVGDWIAFSLWPEQRATLHTLFTNLLVIILKARQLGLTWLVLGFALWLMMFRASAVVLLFSRRDDEAVHLLDDRLKGMWEHLPEWLKYGIVVIEDNDHEWQLSNGSVARAFPTGAGDSYTATLAVVDEADLVPDLNHLMRAVKPTIDAGGRMILISRPNKSAPLSEFKAIYKAAKQKLSDWVAVFLPWNVRPGRDAVWYDAQRRDIFSRTGSLDDLNEQYPASDTEALAPRTLDKRIPPVWIEACFKDESGLRELPAGAPTIPGLKVYKLPDPNKSYVIGADPAEGNPTSDDSAMAVLEHETGEEVAQLAGKLQPSTLAGHIDEVGRWFNNAAALVERNNHGHAVLLWLKENSKLRRLPGYDGKDGWLSNSKGKTLMYSETADAFRDGTTILHSFDTYTQLASIEGSTLRAPEGEHDDKADAYALGIVATTMRIEQRQARSYQG